MKKLGTNSLRILSVLVAVILIAATVKVFDGMGETAAEYTALSAAYCQNDR